MRLLERIDISVIKSVTGVYTAERYACIINDGSKLNWLIMRSPCQIDRILAALRLLGVCDFFFFKKYLNFSLS